MLTTIEGLYENGHVELAEQPQGIDRARVFVTFLVDGPEAPKNPPAGGLEPWLTFLREGLSLGGPPYPTRDELHDRGD